jgi:hypothetical protein
LDQRLATDLPATAEAMPEPANDLPDAELPGAAARAGAAIGFHRNRRSAHPATTPRTMTMERNKQL